MTSQSLPADGDPHRLLAEARDLARRVRVDQRVTWLPLLVLAVVTFAAIPVMRYGTHHIDCTQTGDLRVCKVTHPAAAIYWPIALLAAYAVIAAGYVRVARERGVGTRIRPYAVTGAAIAVAMTLIEVWIMHNLTVTPPNALPEYVNTAFRLIGMSGAIGIGLLVLAWLERSLALLLFTAAYLAVVLIPVTFGWRLGGATQVWAFLPTLTIDGGVLLLGAIGFALARRRQR
ncbi:hypothetical protein [Hamadaea tsunoensis]|uniref:hypothetical protein n=1 Tax=Hamadaea tsunoensis TaxID=53368 RepID=UPI000421431C|nr:hypothetical protein [Hamadaea tsunoensis]